MFLSKARREIAHAAAISGESVVSQRAIEDGARLLKEMRGAQGFRITSPYKGYEKDLMAFFALHYARAGMDMGLEHKSPDERRSIISSVKDSLDEAVRGMPLPMFPMDMIQASVRELTLQLAKLRRSVETAPASVDGDKLMVGYVLAITDLIKTNVGFGIEYNLNYLASAGGVVQRAVSTAGLTPALTRKEEEAGLDALEKVMKYGLDVPLTGEERAAGRRLLDKLNEQGVI